MVQTNPSSCSVRRLFANDHTGHHAQDSNPGSWRSTLQVPSLLPLGHLMVVHLGSVPPSISRKGRKKEKRKEKILIMTATSSKGKFMFAFNLADFSDRILKIEVLSDEAGPTSDEKEEKEEEATNDKDDVPLETNETSCDADCPNILRVEFVHVSSLILAAESQFFFKLFSNGMRESNQKDAALQINASEEAAFMELLRFIYGHKLSSTSHPFALDLVMIADKFEVPSCMDYYIQLAMSFPMTTESALLYLNLPSSVSIASNIQPLTNSAKEFLTNKYKRIMKFKDEVLTLPFTAIEVIFSSDNLIVPAEDIIFDLLVKWARTHYPKLEAQREFFASNLSPLIRFPQISFTRLRKILASEEDEHDMIMKFVSLALLFKAQPPHSLRALAPERWFTERDYSQIPIKMVEFETPFRQCIVYLNLKKDKLAKTYPTEKIFSQDFHLGGHDFYLTVQQCESNGGTCGLFLVIRGEKTADFKVEFEFFVRAKPSGVFESRGKRCHSFIDAKEFGWRDLLGMSWATLMADESRYFIDEVLHLKAEVTIKP